MIEPLMKRPEKRVIFPLEKQYEFLFEATKKLKLSWPEFAERIGVHQRTLNDWKREEYSLPISIFKKISKIAKLETSVNIDIRQPFWSAKKAGKIAGKLVYQRYGRVGGDPKYRKKKWYEWWEREGKFKKHPIIALPLLINIPPKNPDLAEFIGIILGDGSITPSQLTITLHKFDDRYFIDHVKKLFQKLFKLQPSVYERKGENVMNIVVSRKELIRFLLKMELKIGGKVKQQVRVPQWIEKSALFTKFCLKGLFDTDGSFYIDKHYYKDKIYYNCAMNFTNRSLPILFFFKTKLKQFGFNPTHNTKFSICLRKEDEIIKYFKQIGSSNQKHFNKFNKYFKNKYGEVPKSGHNGAVSKTVVP